MLAERLVSLIAEPIEFDGMSLRVGASIGVAAMSDADLDPPTGAASGASEGP